MNNPRSPFPRSPFTRALALTLMTAALAAHALAQSDLRRQTVAVTYPLDQTVTVKFRGTTRLPRMKGEAKVRRTGRRGTRVELEVENLPRAFELGGAYTTFIVWAITPEGRTDNLGEIKRGGGMFVNSKLDATTPLQTFALLVTAEPHFLVRGPSRMVVLENLPPNDPDARDVRTVSVQYLGNTADYMSQVGGVPDIADREYAATPTSLLGARQAVQIARFLGAEREAPNELAEARRLLEKAETGWRLRQPVEEIDADARQATSLAVRAEEVAAERKAARARRDEIARRDAAVREAEETAATAQERINELRTALQKEENARVLAERDAMNANQQVRDLRSEVARLREELDRVRHEGEQAKVQLARIEGERAAETARREAEQRVVKQREALTTLRQTLARFGSVRESARGLVLVLPEKLWADARGSDLAPQSASTVEQLGALLANNPDFVVFIEAYTDNRGDEASLQRLTQDRAEALAGRLVSAGVDSARIRASGMGAANPVAPNTRPATRLRNRRTEITLVPADSSATAQRQ